MCKNGISEEGSVLLSTFYLLLFISFLIISLTSVVRLQVMQLQQISQSYEAKALIEISVDIVKEKIEREDIESGKIYFKEGVVDVQKETVTVYTFVATLPNQYTSRSTIEILRPITEGEPELHDTEQEMNTSEFEDEAIEEPGPEPLDTELNQ